MDGEVRHVVIGRLEAPLPLPQPSKAGAMLATLRRLHETLSRLDRPFDAGRAFQRATAG
jgi:hypothetical protein